MRLVKFSVLPAALLALCGQIAAAQQAVQADYPTKPIRVVVPYAAGGPMDYIGRTLGARCRTSPRW